MHLKCASGKVYSFDRYDVDWYDIRPAEEVDLMKPWDRMVIA